MKRNVGHLMTSELVCVGPSTTFKEIVRLMSEHDISALPVVDAHGVLVGIVSEQDLILKEADPHAEDQPLFEGKRHRRQRMKAAGGVAAELMTKDVISIGPEAKIEDAARTMTDRHVKRLPVVTEDGRLAGIISRLDLLKVFLRDDGEIRQEVFERVVMPSINAGAEEVRVDVDRGLVLLRGHVSRRSLAEGLAQFADVIEGVVGVHNAIDWDENDLSTGDAQAWVGTVLGPGRI
ncbi:MAG: CBS domain-containing protein [Actinomycetota bacterium]